MTGGGHDGTDWIRTWPYATSFLAVSAVTATRVSVDAVSAGTLISISSLLVQEPWSIACALHYWSFRPSVSGTAANPSSETTPQPMR
jgi:hypothetical protein